MKSKKLTAGIILLPIIGVMILVAFDQLMKYLAVLFLKGKDAVVLIKGVLELQYLENHGAAFGMLQEKQWLFWLLTAAFILIVVWFYIRVPKTKHYLPLILTVLVLVSGALGNFIDRLANRYVVDFIYFRIINFPIFNVADIYVTISVIVLICLILFKYKDKDMGFLFAKRKQDS